MSRVMNIERHATHRVGWLRAAVLGANDGIVSTASLVVGIAAAGSNRSQILVAGIAGLVAGAMSMAAGEYVSVSSQADTEHADLEREKSELENDTENERAELANIYVKRGLTKELAKEVSAQLMAHDALGAHARDELGITTALSARPIQAAFSSAGSFTVGAALPILAVWFSPVSAQVPVVVGASIASLALMGAVAARIGGSGIVKSVLRVTFWGALAMGITAAVGALFGTVTA